MAIDLDVARAARNLITESAVNNGIFIAIRWLTFGFAAA
jgi:hypothetical protein